MEQLRTHGEILARLDNRGKSGSELQKETTQRKQKTLRNICRMLPFHVNKHIRDLFK